MTHLAAQKGDADYGQITGVNMEENRFNFFCHLKSSTKRKGVLMEYLELVGKEWENFYLLCNHKMIILRKVLR